MSPYHLEFNYFFIERRQIINPDGNEEGGNVHELPLLPLEEREMGDERNQGRTELPPAGLTNERIHRIVPGRKDQEKLPN